MTKNGIDVLEQHEQLPSFYWLPKLHKKTYSSWFIAASNKCTTKQLLTSCFITIFTNNYCDAMVYLLIIINNYCDGMVYLLIIINIVMVWYTYSL